MLDKIKNIGERMTVAEKIECSIEGSFLKKIEQMLNKYKSDVLTIEAFKPSGEKAVKFRSSKEEILNLFQKLSDDTEKKEISRNSIVIGVDFTELTFYLSDNKLPRSKLRGFLTRQQSYRRRLGSKQPKRLF